MMMMMMYDDDDDDDDDNSDRYPGSCLVECQFCRLQYRLYAAFHRQCGEPFEILFGTSRYRWYHR